MLCHENVDKEYPFQQNLFEIRSRGDANFYRSSVHPKPHDRIRWHVLIINGNCGASVIIFMCLFKQSKVVNVGIYCSIFRISWTLIQCVIYCSYLLKHYHPVFSIKLECSWTGLWCQISLTSFNHDHHHFHASQHKLSPCFIAYHQSHCNATILSDFSLFNCVAIFILQ